MANTVNSTTYVPKEYSYKNKKEFTSELDQNAFMKLLIEQLKNQDPLSPMDNQQFIQQTSMMTMVERLTRMQTLMEESNSSLLNIREYEGLIGKTATYEKETQDEDTGETTRETKTGTISGVKMVDGKIVFTIGDDIVPREQINGLESKGAANDSLMDNTLKYAQMIGKQVTYLQQETIDKDGNPQTQDDQYTTDVEKTGIITSLSMKNGAVQFVLDNGTTVKLDDIIGLQVAPDNLPVDNTLKYLQLVGSRVTYNEQQVNQDGTTTTVEHSGVITSISMKNGLIEFQLDNNKKLKPGEITGLQVEAK